MSYTHLSIIERSKLEALYQLGLSARAIARKLNRHHSTISRELKKNQSPDGYLAAVSEQRYQRLRQSHTLRGNGQSNLVERLRNGFMKPGLLNKYLNGID